MRNWHNLGFVETIYEEEDDYEFSSASPTLSPAIYSPSTPLYSRVDSWSRAIGQNTEVSIRVQGKCFRLHKDPLTSRSTYLKRQLTAFVSDFTLPLNISAETFTFVADFCYGARLVITLFNVAALRTAAELLEMTETNDDCDDHNLLHLTDAYFRQVVAVNRDYASVVFRSCMALLPEAETAAFLVSRCIEALALSGDGDGHMDWLHEVITVSPEHFQIVVEVIQRRFGSHDIVYELVDLYIMRYSGKIIEEQKSQICSSIDCSKLSPQVLLEAVQNPIMPLRFVVRAMLMEQLNTRRTILTAAADPLTQQLLQQQHDDHLRKFDEPPADEVTTLGSLLQRDTMFRQSARLKATMAATSTRIKTLEEEVHGMKKLLEECHNEKNERSIMAEAGRGRKSASFHFGSSDDNSNSMMITRSDRGSASSSSFQFITLRGKDRTEETSWCKETPVPTKSISQRLISGLKKPFRVSGSKNVSDKKIVNCVDDGGDNKEIVMIE